MFHLPLGQPVLRSFPQRWKILSQGTDTQQCVWSLSPQLVTRCWCSVRVSGTEPYLEQGDHWRKVPSLTGPTSCPCSASVTWEQEEVLSHTHTLSQPWSPLRPYLLPPWWAISSQTVSPNQPFLLLVVLGQSVTGCLLTHKDNL